jgi:predicted enzyme related to lactoylglutathione lyase
VGKPTIRHLAIYTTHTDRLADFYVKVFDMEITRRAGPVGQGPVFLSDGYMNVAILPHSAKNETAVGLNHFGFQVDSVADITQRLLAAGVASPAPRPAGRYAEFRAADPCGNMFDLSEHGFTEVP